MKVIVITSQKGGSGKTTLAANLAVEAERAGDVPAWLVDTDKQGTLSKWHTRRKSETPRRAEMGFEELAIGLRNVATKHGGAFCFIDTAPAISDQTGVIIKLADLVLIPVQPSPADLWAAAETIELVRAAQKPFLFVMTKVKAQASITAQTIAALSHTGPVARAFIADRVVYAAALTGGNTAPELTPRGAAAAEVAALWYEVKSCFHEKMKSVRKVKHG
ncbi:MAG: AAA family ATPase [Acetobacteraceae bacterium]